MSIEQKLLDYNTKLTLDDRCDIATEIEQLKAQNMAMSEAFKHIQAMLLHRNYSNDNKIAMALDMSVEALATYKQTIEGCSDA